MITFIGALVAVLLAGVAVFYAARTRRDVRHTWASLARTNRINAERWSLLDRPDRAAECLAAAEACEKRARRWFG